MRGSGRGWLHRYRVPSFTGVSATRSWEGTAAVVLVSGIAAIWLFLRLLRSNAFHLFSYYTWIVGAAFLGWLALRGAAL